MPPVWSQLISSCFVSYPQAAESSDKYWDKKHGLQPAPTMKFVAFCMRKWGLMPTKKGTTIGTVVGGNVGTAARRLVAVFRRSMQP